MPLNTVQNFMKTQLNNLALPGQSLNLACYISPPSSTELSQPICFVWGSTFAAIRQTAPRVQGQGSGGYMKYTYIPDIWLYLQQTQDDPSADAAMPLVVDAVMAKLMAFPLPAWLYDPNTTEKSQLIAIGERFQVQYAPVKTVQDQRFVIYQANIKTTIEEVINA